MVLVRVAQTQAEIDHERWWYDSCALYIRPWYRQATWYIGWWWGWIRGHHG